MSNQRKRYGEFEVPKETHGVLAWMFNRLPFITDVMKAQIAGENLDVDGIGTFDVDWHLGGDLKTIKCMLGCKKGALVIEEDIIKWKTENGMVASCHVLCLKCPIFHQRTPARIP